MLLVVLGAIAMIAPLFSSVWGVPAVGVAIFLAGIVELTDAWYSDSSRTHYSSGIFSVLAGVAHLAPIGVRLQRADGRRPASCCSPTVAPTSSAPSAGQARRRQHRCRSPGVGLHQRRRQHRPRRDRLVAARHDRRARLRLPPRRPHGGVRVADAGRSLRPATAMNSRGLRTNIPNRALGVPPHPIIGFIHREAVAHSGSRTPADFYWSVIFVVVFFAIHVGRLDAEWTLAWAC